MLARRSLSRYLHPSRVAESKQPILAQSYAKLGRENPTVEEDRREKERGRERKRERGGKGSSRKGCTYCIRHDAIVVVGSVCTSLVCEKRARLPRATRASKYWLLFESVIRCLRTHGFSPRVSTYLSAPPRRRYPSNPHVAPCAAIPHADIYTAPVCSLYFWLRARNSTFLSVRVNSLARRRDLSPGRFGRS